MNLKVITINSQRFCKWEKHMYANNEHKLIHTFWPYLLLFHKRLNILQPEQVLSLHFPHHVLVQEVCSACFHSSNLQILVECLLQILVQAPAKANEKSNTTLYTYNFSASYYNSFSFNMLTRNQALRSLTYPPKYSPDCSQIKHQWQSHPGKPYS